VLHLRGEIDRREQSSCRPLKAPGNQQIKNSVRTPLSG
jgi:hypothetical protein